MKSLSLVTLLLLSMTALPSHADSLSGMIFNDSGKEISERIVRHLTTRWHFGAHTPDKNLEIRDVIQGAALEKLVFDYGGDIIYHYQIPKARLKSEELTELSDAIYVKIVKTDIQKKRQILKKLSALNKNNKGAQQ